MDEDYVRKVLSSSQLLSKLLYYWTVWSLRPIMLIKSMESINVAGLILETDLLLHVDFIYVQPRRIMTHWCLSLDTGVVFKHAKIFGTPNYIHAMDRSLCAVRSYNFEHKQTSTGRPIIRPPLHNWHLYNQYTNRQGSIVDYYCLLYVRVYKNAYSMLLNR